MFTPFGTGSGGAAPVGARGIPQTLRGYWEALRQGGSIPRRADIDPRGLADCLEYVFLIERIAPGHARFRLAGMHLTDLMGMDMRGMPLTALFDPGARKQLVENVEQVFSAPSILDVQLEAERGIGRRALAGHMLLLPVRGDADEPALALGCLTTEGAIGRAPRRFAVARVMQETVLPRLQVVPAMPAERPCTAAPVVPLRPRLRLVSSRD